MTTPSTIHKTDDTGLTEKNYSKINEGVLGQFKGYILFIRALQPTKQYELCKQPFCCWTVEGEKMRKGNAGGWNT